jgi:hypothetical protein
LNGTFVFVAIMDIRARSISFASRPRRPYGPPDHERAGETFSPSPQKKPTQALPNLDRINAHDSEQAVRLLLGVSAVSHKIEAHQENAEGDT